MASPAGPLTQTGWVTPLAGRRVCVTGGAGFIGSHVVEALCAAGASVRVIDDFSSGDWRNTSGWGARVELVQASIRDEAAVRRAVDRASLVVHLAAYVSAAQSLREPELYQQTNAGGTADLVRAAARSGVRRLVFASSSAVYGQGQVQPIPEDLPLAPLSPYAHTKQLGERHLEAAVCAEGLSGVSLRFFNVYGPRQAWTSAYAAVITAFARALLEGDDVRIEGDGLQTRDFVHVSDIVRAILCAGSVAMDRPHRVLNVGTGRATTICELLRAMAAVCGVCPRVRHAAAREGDVRHSVADPAAARALLGIESAVGLEQGLEATLEWYRAERPWIASCASRSPTPAGPEACARLPSRDRARAAPKPAPR